MSTPTRKRVWAYLDGFNLFNGALRGTAYKWLDPQALCRHLCPGDDIQKVKFFTARIRPRVTDPSQTNDQLTYWSALRTLGCVDIIEGKFCYREKYLPLVAAVRQLRLDANAGINVVGSCPAMAHVVKVEEKGTDVNLGVHFVHDAHRDRFDRALIFSNDSVLCGAFRIVTHDIGKEVDVIRPRNIPRLAEMIAVTTSYRALSVADLAASQLPDVVRGKRGPITKPTGW